jgi:uridine kinase
MLKAFYAEFGSDNIDKVSVEYSLGNGLYCEYSGKIPLTDERIAAVKRRMKELVNKNLPFMKRSIGTDDAIELFRRYRMYDKEKLFKYRRVSKANIYNLDGFEDYYYGYMPPSSGMLKYFDLMKYEEGYARFITKLPDLLHNRLSAEKKSV